VVRWRRSSSTAQVSQVGASTSSSDVNLGSEASEAALKIVTQYFTKERSPPQPDRTLFIAREQSYHGNTLGALDASDHKARKVLYKGILAGNMRSIPACNAYRNLKPGQTDEEYVQWHKDALLAEIEASENRIAALLIEPVVGAVSITISLTKNFTHFTYCSSTSSLTPEQALGCAPAVPGYLRMIRNVCDDHDIILVFDEIMCGMGRTGYLHAWQTENVVPDIQLVGKSLAAGFQAISAMLVGPKLINAFKNGPSNGAFCHGHTFQSQAMPAAAGLAVQQYVEEFSILENVRKMGPLLGMKLRGRLESHRYVGDIRGPAEGLFWGVSALLSSKCGINQGHR
jgi:adenosylmethionine-8-amino-7-oxononanoate aminotransferase